MTDKGKLIYMSPVESGTSQSGTAWSKMTIVIEMTTQYGTRHVAIGVGGNKISFFNDIRVGDTIEVGYIVSARQGSGQYQGRWFNDVSLVTVKKEGAAAPQQYAAPAATQQYQRPPQAPAPNYGAAAPQQPAGGNPDDDLPF